MWFITDNDCYADDLYAKLGEYENLDCYEICHDIKDYDDLERYYIEELDAIQVPKHLKNYIDYEAYGQDIAIDENGTFTDQVYIWDAAAASMSFTMASAAESPTCTE